MKKLLLLVVWGLIATQSNADFGESKACQKCHSNIYNEFYNSSHRKSSIYNDPIHKAVWDKHPLKEKEKYTCAKCHTPTDKALLKNLAEGKPASPEANYAQLEEGISCLSCHAIDSIKEHDKANINIMTNKPKTLFSAREGQEGEKDVSFKTKSSFFGMFVEKSGSPYHKIDYSNKGFYDGSMCMGCHSHKQNAHKFEVCRTDIKGSKDKKQNCISCHMPSVKGTMNSVSKTDTHLYHGFTGAADRPEMLAPHIDIGFKQTSKGFDINIKNSATHPLFLHPLRIAQLQVVIQRGDKRIDLDPISFSRTIGANGEATMPWLANSVVKDTQIQAGEDRTVSFDYALKEGDKIETKLGFYLLSKKASKKLGLSSQKELSKFRLLKEEQFNIPAK